MNVTNGQCKNKCNSYPNCKPCGDKQNISLSHLEEVRDQIINWDIDKQAEYADGVCVMTVDENNTEFLKKQMDSVDVNDHSLFETFNTTSIGNLAYLIRNAPIEYAEKAKEILENYKIYKLNK